ncbi:hypothetical protein CYMTET_29276 [Cymbomonas tetramitiformis]|uniref:Uncharacterized protein n=1 Tax=Cymbomonas tetramitiformis TaxID=36881 RepID=A0AAE0FL59_9CHLO|nr:hypothetical protein CYMTET_29276 [Cymbomonas tetramitiformis]
MYSDWGGKMKGTRGYSDQKGKMKGHEGRKTKGHNVQHQGGKKKESPGTVIRKEDEGITEVAGRVAAGGAAPLVGARVQSIALHEVECGLAEVRREAALEAEGVRGAASGFGEAGLPMQGAWKSVTEALEGAVDTLRIIGTGAVPSPTMVLPTDARLAAQASAEGADLDATRRPLGIGMNSLLEEVVEAMGMLQMAVAMSPEDPDSVVGKAQTHATATLQTAALAMAQPRIQRHVRGPRTTPHLQPHLMAQPRIQRHMRDRTIPHLQPHLMAQPRIQRHEALEQLQSSAMAVRVLRTLQEAEGKACAATQVVAASLLSTLERGRSLPLAEGDEREHVGSQHPSARNDRMESEAVPSSPMRFESTAAGMAAAEAGTAATSILLPEAGPEAGPESGQMDAGAHTMASATAGLGRGLVALWIEALRRVRGTPATIPGTPTIAPARVETTGTPAIAAAFVEFARTPAIARVAPQSDRLASEQAGDAGKASPASPPGILQLGSVHGAFTTPHAASRNGHLPTSATPPTAAQLFLQMLPPTGGGGVDAAADMSTYVSASTTANDARGADGAEASASCTGTSITFHDGARGAGGVADMRADLPAGTVTTVTNAVTSADGDTVEGAGALVGAGATANDAHNPVGTTVDASTDLDMRAQHPRMKLEWSPIREQGTGLTGEHDAPEAAAPSRDAECAPELRGRALSSAEIPNRTAAERWTYAMAMLPRARTTDRVRFSAAAPQLTDLSAPARQAQEVAEQPAKGASEAEGGAEATVPVPADADMNTQLSKREALSQPAGLEEGPPQGGGAPVLGRSEGVNSGSPRPAHTETPARAAPRVAVEHPTFSAYLDRHPIIISMPRPKPFFGDHSSGAANGTERHVSVALPLSCDSPESSFTAGHASERRAGIALQLPRDAPANSSSAARHVEDFVTSPATSWTGAWRGATGQLTGSRPGMAAPDSRNLGIGAAHSSEKLEASGDTPTGALAEYFTPVWDTDDDWGESSIATHGWEGEHVPEGQISSATKQLREAAVAATESLAAAMAMSSDIDPQPIVQTALECTSRIQALLHPPRPAVGGTPDANTDARVSGPDATSQIPSPPLAFGRCVQVAAATPILPYFPFRHQCSQMECSAVPKAAHVYTVGALSRVATWPSHLAYGSNTWPVKQGDCQGRVVPNALRPMAASDKPLERENGAGTALLPHALQALRWLSAAVPYTAPVPPITSEI